MDKETSTPIKCPACGIVDKRTSSSDFNCQACGHAITLSGHYCPDCFEYSDENRVSCSNCGAVLMQSCTNCGRENWSGAHSCSYCGQSLDIFASVAGRYSPSATAERLQAQMKQVKTIRAIDEAASSSRMEDLNRAESARQAALKEQEGIRRQKDRLLLAGAAAIVILFILAIIVVALAA